MDATTLPDSRVASIQPDAPPISTLFLSYGSPDRELVEQVARVLRDEDGYRVWFDQWELEPGAEWVDRLGDILIEASHCLVFFGPQKLRPWQREEVRVAIDRRVTKAESFTVIPVLLPGAGNRPPDSGLERFLLSRQWCDFTGGLDDANGWHRLRSGIERRSPGAGPAATMGECPYKGLHAFGVDDASAFFGREAAVDQLLARLGERLADPVRPNFLALIGPSGSGKSSLAQAGLLSAIKNRRLNQHGDWCRDSVIVPHPGARPLEALAHALVRHPVLKTRFATLSVDELVNRMRSANDGFRYLHNEVSVTLPEGQRLVIYLDQFEECLVPLAEYDLRKANDQEDDQREAGALVNSPDAYLDNELRPFIENLAVAVREAHGPITVLLSMRDDFYGRCLDDPVLAALVTENSSLIGPLSRDELRDAIEKPALDAGKRVDPGLVSILQRDVLARRGALPLLQDVLTQMWPRAGGALTADLYSKLGGIEKALGQRASACYQRILADTKSVEERNVSQMPLRQRLCREIFLKLVQRRGSEGLRSRARPSRAELPQGQECDEVLAAFGDERILSSGRDEASGEENWELVHEALIWSWPTLATWLDDQTTEDRLREQLAVDAGTWQRATEESVAGDNAEPEQSLDDEAYLYQGNRLKPVAEWPDRDDVPLTPVEQEFIHRSKQVETKRQQTIRSRTNNQRMMFALLGVIVVAFSALFLRNWIDSGRLTVNAVTIDESPLTDTARIQINDEGGYWWRRYFIPRGRHRISVTAGDWAGFQVVEIAAGESNEREIKLVNRAELAKSLNANMVNIPGGAFRMGSSDGHDDEQPVREVTIKPFLLAKTELSFEHYDPFVEATGYQKPDDEDWGRGNRPVIYVSWNDAKFYIEWLNQVTGQTWRLPTEAEWEYAARGGTPTAYWWGDELGRNRANCVECGSEWDNDRTAPVGSFEANGYGVYDTAGNVWEWVEDCWHGSYEGAPVDGSAWLSDNGGGCDSRVLRGGSWYLNAANLRSADRYWFHRAFRDFSVGFRLARTK